MNLGLEIIAGNVGMTIPNLILMITTIGGIIFYAKNFQLGLVMQLLGSAGLFMWFYNQNWVYVPALVVMLITVVLLSFSLYAASRASIRGDII